jgi:hypothetical protein
VIAKQLNRLARRTSLVIPGGVRSSGRKTTVPRVRGEKDEKGAILILALVFLLLSGGIVGALANWTTNDLTNTTSFASARSLHYAADDATNLAIQNIRYAPLLSTGQTLNASPPSSCWSTSSNPIATIDGESMDVWCSTAWNPSSAKTRVVTFSTCLQVGVLNNASAANCASTPLLQAVVTFDDYPAGVSVPSLGQCVVYCGTGVTVNSWAWLPVVPNVTSIGTTSGSITGGTSVTISGTGFVPNATTVNFVEESADTPTGDNTIVPATVTSVSQNSITASSPGVIAGTTYFVTVTTPGGTSADGPVFTYLQNVAPTVSSIGQTTGSSTGGTLVTINGTGFVTGATVNFVEESSGIPSTPAVSLPATYVTVDSSAKMTAVSPAIVAGTTYFVTVTTPGGTVRGPVFTYLLLYPIVSGISPASGSTAGGTTVTITGTGFLNGSTVAFGLIPSLSVTVVSSTSITATSPPGIAGVANVSVTTAAGTSSNVASFTYS